MSKIITLTQNDQWFAYNGYNQNQILSILPLNTSNINADNKFVGDGDGAYLEMFITRNKLAGSGGFELDFDTYTPMGDAETGKATVLEYCYAIDLESRQALDAQINAIQWTVFILRNANAQTSIQLRIESDNMQSLKFSEELKATIVEEYNV